MPIHFSRTLRSIRGDRFQRATIFLAVTLVFFLAWTAWFFLAEVTVYEASERARLEVDRDVVPIELWIGGRLAQSHLTPGAEVKVGEVLLKLDATEPRLRRDEAADAVLHLRRELAALELTIAAVEGRLDESRKLAALAAEQGRREHQASQTAYDLEAEEARLMQQLHDEGQLSDLELVRQSAEAERQSQLTDAQRLQMLQKEEEKKAREKEGQVDLARLGKEKAELEGDLARARHRLTSLEHEVERHVVRAPTSGRLAEVEKLRVGQILEAGERIGSILPAGELTLVAFFSPQAAVGRIAHGQRGRFRLDGFPWTRYGSLGCTVTHVAAETRDGDVRVLLALDDEAATAIPLRHALPGSVEIGLEKLSPAALLLRDLGLRESASRRDSPRRPPGGS